MVSVRQTQTARYKTSLSKPIPQHDLSQFIRHGRLDELANEDTVTALVTVNNLLPVGNALHAFYKGLHYAPGSKFFRQQSDGSPDWGLGSADFPNDGLYSLRNFCPGDVKMASKWKSEDLLHKDWSNYLDVQDLLNKARPLEQTQHYGINLSTRYAWVLTEEALVVIRIRSSTDEPRLPRPARDITHRRIASNTSALSGAFSTMSIDHSAYSGHSGSSSGINPAALELARIPWSASGKEMTINLALYFLARLAWEDCSISTSYPPLDPKAPKVWRPAEDKRTGILETQSQSPQTPPLNPNTVVVEYWIPSEGISWKVISADLTVYLPDAAVEQKTMNDKPGYLVKAVTQVEQDEITAMLADLKADTISWGKEGKGKGKGTSEYRRSTAHKSRKHYGSTYRNLHSTS